MLSQLVSFVLVAASNARQEEFVPVFKEHSSSSFVHDKGYTVVEKSFISQTFPLLPGQMVFTKARRTPITMPTGRYAVLAFSGDIGKRDPNNSSAYIAAPLTEVYGIDHWSCCTLALNFQICQSTNHIGRVSLHRPSLGCRIK